MGILDEAIREHLELKRQHGADDSELKELEDDAFGPPQRPGAEPAAGDGPSEAATEFMQQPDLGGEEGAPEPDGGEAPAATQASARREPIADVQEAPERAEEDEDEEDDAQDEHEDDEPAEEEQPAGEHETVPTPRPAGHTTAERHAIADQPTEMFDVAGELAASEAAPSDEELVAEEITEPRLSPAPAEPVEDEDDEDDFFDEQRLSDELDQALEAPIEADSEELEPISEEVARPVPKVVDPDPDSEEIVTPAAPRNDDEDVLEETPDFLEEAPEDDQLWFEQKPPKDFDFDD